MARRRRRRLILGRMATEVARVLRGKHKPDFTPNLDTGDHVIIVNAEKVVLTGRKATDKQVYRHSGYPAACTRTSYGHLLEEPQPAEGCARTVKGMLPKNRLGRQMLSKLKVYAGPLHPTKPSSSAPRDFRGSIPHRRLLMPDPLTQATGRRKRAVARVRFRPGTGQVTVNGREAEDYFPSQKPSDGVHGTPPSHPYRRGVRHRREHARRRGQRPGRRTSTGHRPGLVALDPELREVLKQAGFLTRDDRKKESKKYGLKKARKAPQYSKR